MFSRRRFSRTGLSSAAGYDVGAVNYGRTNSAVSTWSFRAHQCAHRIHRVIQIPLGAALRSLAKLTLNWTPPSSTATCLSTMEKYLLAIPMGSSVCRLYRFGIFCNQLRECLYGANVSLGILQARPRHLWELRLATIEYGINAYLYKMLKRSTQKDIETLSQFLTLSIENMMVGGPSSIRDKATL